MRTLCVLLVLAGLAFAGCGPEGDLVEHRPAVSEQAATAELGASPARTALAWWSSLRLHDSEALVARLTPAARRTIDLRNLSLALRGKFGEWAEAAEAHVLYTERAPDHATVYMRIDAGRLVGSRIVRGGAMMLALPFESRDGVWLIENAAWLRGQVDFDPRVKERLRRELRRELEERG